MIAAHIVQQVFVCEIKKIPFILRHDNKNWINYQIKYKCV